MKTRKSNGFTLIELAIVLAVVAILAAVASVRFANITGRAGDAAVEATAASVRSAYTIYVANNSAVPGCDQLAAELPNLVYDTTNNTGTVSSSGSITTVACTEAGTPPTVTEVRIYNNRASTYNSATTALVVEF